MPAYNQGQYIGEATQSVLEQSYPRWELIIVDDGSTDSTADIVKQFGDDRIKFIYQSNRGVSEARNVGIEASSGEYLAFLDADDKYLPHKIEAQVAHLDRERQIGVTYCSRIEIDQDGNPFKLHRPPARASLRTLVLGFPFAPTDFMVRREWAEKVNGFNNTFSVNEDRDFWLRMSLVGCQFEGVDRFLSYHRYYDDRIYQNLPSLLNTSLNVLKALFNNPRCPEDIYSMYDLTHRNVYKDSVYIACISGDTNLTPSYYREVMRFDTTKIGGKPDDLFEIFDKVTKNDSEEYALMILKLLATSPSELGFSSERIDWEMAHNYLNRGVSKMLWKRLSVATDYFVRSINEKRRLDRKSLHRLSDKLLNYEVGYSQEATHVVLKSLYIYLLKIGGESVVQWLKRNYMLIGNPGKRNFFL
jgi:glycosyltransferase involved in cell wall biosynthesis